MGDRRKRRDSRLSARLPHERSRSLQDRQVISHRVVRDTLAFRSHERRSIAGNSISGDIKRSRGGEGLS